MEIQGRECKEIKIGEHSYWFIEKYKGGDVRKMYNIMVVKGKLSLKEGTILLRLPKIFSILCLRVDDDVEPTLELIDNLSVSDYTKIQNQVIEEVTNLFTEIQ